MKITDKLIKQITETKYLTVENSWRYRVIIRYFYEQFEQINYILYKEDVYNELKKHSMFLDYTIEQCSLDLETLVVWGNLISRVRFKIFAECISKEKKAAYQESLKYDICKILKEII